MNAEIAYEIQTLYICPHLYMYYQLLHSHLNDILIAF